MFQRTDAFGKDYIIIPTTAHVAPAQAIDYEKAFQLALIATMREIEDKRIQYVLIGHNNGNAPHKAASPFDQRSYYTFGGHVAGSSIDHPHLRVASMAFLPPTVKEFYNSSESIPPKAYQIMTDGTTTIYADPMPDHTGGLIVISDTPNITELGLDGIKGLATMVQFAQVLIDETLGYPPTTGYSIQSFDRSSGFMAFKLVPRTSVPAFLELGTGIKTGYIDPLETARMMRELISP